MKSAAETTAGLPDLAIRPSGDASPPSRPAPRRPSSAAWPRRRTLLIVASTLLLYHAVLLLSSTLSFPGRLLPHWAPGGHPARPSPAPGHPDAAASWSSVPSSERLTFQRCPQTIAPNDYDCARLKLPLDYWNGTNPDKSIQLAVLRIPARVPVTHPNYGGSVLINPGGPGGSGVLFALLAGSELQAMVDYTAASAGSAIGANRSEKYFDIIGFDPRGIGATSPGAHCWESESFRKSWALRVAAQGLASSSDSAPGRLWSMAHALGSSCAGSIKNGDDIKQFLTTASVARDMLELTEALGAWREEQAQKELHLSHQQAARRQGRAAPRAAAVPEHLLHKPGEEKLQFWGFSYGTFLGSTFAAMFPDRVGRVVLDGVVWASDYSKTLWTSNLLDTEKVVEAFYDTCARSMGRCALAEPGETAETMKVKVQEIFTSLYHNPLPIAGDIPDVITYSDIKAIAFSVLYAPVATFGALAMILKAVQDRDTAIFKGFVQNHELSCTYPNGTAPAPSDGEAQLSIICSDGDDQTTMDLKAYQEYWHHLESISPSGGALWSAIRLGCSGWPIRGLHRFSGPFKGNTSHPILWIGNTADPVTPLWGAKKMSESYVNSVALTLDAPGHCSLAAFSGCTIHAISRYFGTGELPAENTICHSTSRPFGLPPDDGDDDDSSHSLSKKASTIHAIEGQAAATEEDVDVFRAKMALKDQHETAGEAFLSVLGDAQRRGGALGVGVEMGLGGRINLMEMVTSLRAEEKRKRAI